MEFNRNLMSFLSLSGIVCFALLCFLATSVALPGCQTINDLSHPDSTKVVGEIPSRNARIEGRESLNNRFSRYRRTKFMMGKHPFGPIQSPAKTSDNSGVVDFLELKNLRDLSPLPSGWYHQKFANPSHYTIVEIDDRQAIRGQAKATSSILYRHADLDAERFPYLNWTWRVERPVTNRFSDHFAEGDDKSARLFLTVLDSDGVSQWMEIVWANHVEAGQLIFVHGFPHYVSDGPSAPTKQWLSHEVDVREIFERFWPDKTLKTVTGIGFMVDSDDGGSEAVSYLAQLEMHQLSTERFVEQQVTNKGHEDQ